MKVAVISDIHGNMQALEAVINDYKSQNCEKVLCLGDLAMAGPQPSETVDFVKGQNWEIIQGNTDKMIAEFSDKILSNVKSAFPVMGNALENDAEILSEVQKEYLANLSPQKELIMENVKVLMVHGSPRRNNEDILPNRPIEEIEEIIANTDADLILCGHTHIPCGYQTSKKQTVVNAGSVGRPFTDNAKACYAIIDFNSGAFSVEHRFVDYNREKAAEILAQRKFQGAEKLAGILLKPETRHL
ncbi:metallophosphoesterase family protein [bacterium]|nr:metallophosphoesterase family protein [bacterium]